MKHPKIRHIKAICSVLVCFVLDWVFFLGVWLGEAAAWKWGFIFHVSWPFCHTFASLFLTWPLCEACDSYCQKEVSLGTSNWLSLQFLRLGECFSIRGRPLIIWRGGGAEKIEKKNSNTSSLRSRGPKMVLAIFFLGWGHNIFFHFCPSPPAPTMINGSPLNAWFPVNKSQRWHWPLPIYSIVEITTIRKRW